MKMSPKGQITCILRDQASMNITDEQVTCNIVTDLFYEQLSETMSLTDLNIVINGKEMAASRYQRIVPCNVDGNIAFYPDIAIPSVLSREFFPASGSTPAFIQCSGRFNPPALARTIKTILLTNNSYQGNLNYQNDSIKSLAYAKLNTPCIQTPSQVLDVYYRIFFPIEANKQSALMLELLNKFNQSAYGNSLLDTHYVYPTPIVTKAKAGDENRSLVCITGMHFGIMHGQRIASSYANSKRVISLNTAFNDSVGTIFSSLLSGGKNPVITAQDFVASSLGDDSYAPVLLGASNLKTLSKIQNLIGHSTSVKPFTASPWLDVDNLPNGTGKIYLAGTWLNRDTPASPELYYRALLPEWNCLQITGSGKVSDGSAKYTYFRQPFFGLKNLPNNVGGSTYASYAYSANSYTLNVLPSLCASASPVGAPVNYWRSLSYDSGKTIVEEITSDYLGARQISAAHKYDDGAFVLVKKNKVLLYSVGAGDYWKFNGPYTDIHQVTVVEGKIYIACRNTGLYVIDPLNSLTVVALPAPSADVDLSRCFGVAKGFGNTVWCVGVNGLMKLQAGVWTKYDNASAAPFSIMGVSDGRWSNIDYLKIDEESAAFEMMLVRRLDADVNAASFGIWWSPSSGAVNSFNDNASLGMGSPRTNRTHFGGTNGLWAIANGTHKVMAFKADSPISVIGGVSIPDNKIGDIYASVFFVRDAANQTRLLSMFDSKSYDPWTTIQGMKVKLVDVLGNITSNEDTGLFISAASYTNAPFGKSGSRARATASYGYADEAASFILSKGVMVTLWCGTENKTNDYGVGQGTMDNFTVSLSNYALGLSLDGGPLAYLARRQYGWTGSVWSEAVSDSKPTHVGVELLSDGVGVRFEEGASGNSFSTPNYYRFGLSEGLLKDNATRNNLYAEFYTRRRVTSSETSLATVPVVAALPNGDVGVNASLSSAGSYLNASGQFQFPAEAGVQYVIGDKELSGDFELSYDVTGINTTVELNTHTAFGVGKPSTFATMFFGFQLANKILYFYNGATYTNSYTALSNVASLKIKRTLGVLSLLINDRVVLTNDYTLTGIRSRDDRLAVVGFEPQTINIAQMIPNRLCPKATIVTNGSDRMVYFGNPSTKTGTFGKRFCGEIILLETTVKLNGVLANLKSDGTEPAAGEVTIDTQMGSMYFNAADEGKAIAATTTWQQTE